MAWCVNKKRGIVIIESKGEKFASTLLRPLCVCAQSSPSHAAQEQFSLLLAVDDCDFSQTCAGGCVCACESARVLHFVLGREESLISG